MDDLPALRLTVQSLLAELEPAEETAESARASDPEEHEDTGIIPDPFRTPSPFDSD